MANQLGDEARDYKGGQPAFYANRYIPAGEELVFNYRPGWTPTPEVSARSTPLLAYADQ
jgi:hypothetical protein